MNEKRVDQVVTRRLSLVAAGGLGLALVAGGILLGAALGYRTQVLGLGTAFSLLRWGAYGGGAALVISFLGVVLTLAQRTRVRGLAIAALGVLIGAVCYTLPAQQQAMAREFPPIHDITTDTDDPPGFVAVLPLRADAPNPAEYDPSVAAQQREAYPDLTSITLDVPPAQALEQALAAVQVMGWELVAEEAEVGRIEATATTFWFGFKDDVVVRIRPADGGSRIDVRSVSRVGRGDVGANARRIREFRRELTGE